MTTTIHPSAVVDPKATLGTNVSIGPFCVVGADVTLGDGVELKSHVVVDGQTTIGEKTVVFPFASLGTVPQDKKYHGEPSTLEIGSHNMIREYTTMNPGTEGGGMVTKVGSHGLFMMSSHVAHDCIVGDHVILANHATLAGHVELGDHAILGGLAAVHQFVRIGAHAMIGGMSGIESDVIPYGVVTGERANLVGINILGLKRRGFSRDDIHAIRQAYKDIFMDEEGTLTDRVTTIKNASQENDQVQEIINFLEFDSSRAICQPKKQVETHAA